MKNNEQTDLPIIYGIMDEPSYFGVQAYAIDGQTSECIDEHFCSSEGFAKSDLGFSSPLFDTIAFSEDPHSTTYFNDMRKRKYSERYPNGYRLVWIGEYHDNEIIIKLRNMNHNENDNGENI